MFSGPFKPFGSGPIFPTRTLGSGPHFGTYHNGLPSLSPDLGYRHVSDAHSYIHWDPILRIGVKKKQAGEDGLMDVKSEIAATAAEKGMLDLLLKAISDEGDKK